MNDHPSGLNNSAEERDASNNQARSTWERKAVGSQRAQSVAGSTQYYEQIRSYRYGYETPFIPEYFDFSGLAGGKRVLEVGVGNGIDAVEMMRNGACYTGIDITHNHLELTRRYVQLEHEAGRALNVEAIIDGDLLETELPGEYDVIYSFGVLHHIAHEEAVLSRLHELLADDGELRIAVYARASVFNLWMIVTWLFRNHMRYPLQNWKSHLAEGSHLDEPVVIKIRGRKQVQTMLEKAGFRVERYGRKGFVQGYLPIIGRFFKSDGPILNAFASVFGWYHCFICHRVD